MDPREWLDHDPSVERWLRFKADSTKKVYKIVLDEFLTFTAPQTQAKDPSGLIAWAKQRDNLEVGDLIEKWGETQSSSSHVSRMSIVRSLLKRNGLSLPSMEGKRDVLKQFHRGYSREEIQNLLGYLDQPFQKLYVLAAKDTGLRAADLLSIRYGHVKKDLERGLEYVHLYLEPKYYNRKKASGLTFLGPNSVKLLKQLIDQKLVSKDPDARIFPFEYPTIKESLKIGKRKAGLDPVIQPSHGFRKFFENCLDRTGLDVDKKRQLEGHSLGVRFHYTDRDVDALRKLYEQAYQYLDLSEEGIVDKTILDLKTTVEHLTKEVSEKTGHIESLKEELSKQKEVETLVREYLPLLRELSKDPEIKKRLASLKTE